MIPQTYMQCLVGYSVLVMKRELGKMTCYNPLVLFEELENMSVGSGLIGPHWFVIRGR